MFDFLAFADTIMSIGKLLIITLGRFIHNIERYFINKSLSFSIF